MTLSQNTRKKLKDLSPCQHVKITKALILAAGLGTRLLPYSSIRPKPLFTLGGIAILEINIRNLIQAGCTDIIVNTHHLHQQIEKFIKKTKFPVHVETRHEPKLLDTGGAIKNVQNFMKDSPFFVINSDIISDIDLKKAGDFHLKGNWPATLVMHNYPKFNKVEVNNDHFITGFFKTVSNRTRTLGTDPVKVEHDLSDYRQILAFTGVQILSPEIFQYMPLKNEFSSIEFYKNLAQMGNLVKAYICRPYWSDIGTTETYHRACILHTAASCFNNQDRTWNHRRNQTSSQIPDLKAFKIRQLKGDGSDRKWFRVEGGQKRSFIIADHGIYPENINICNSWENKTQTACKDILHLTEEKNREIDSFIAIGHHLSSSGIPVPEIMGYDLFSGMVALEDLGDIHLQQVINCLDSENEIIKWYQKICDHLINFSIKGIKNFNPAWTFQTKTYTRELIIEKECLYFINAFIRSYLKKKINPDDFKETFEFIADNAMKYSFTGLMHRDMQSRNIMIKNGQIFFIDFQSARKGPLQYDLASLLIDPYVNLNHKIREAILTYCASKINMLTGFDKDKFIRCFKFCVLTRNMQILGAFSYLSMVKKKKSFENYIPCALNNLTAAIEFLNHETNGKLEPIHNILNNCHGADLVFGHGLSHKINNFDEA